MSDPIEITLIDPSQQQAGQKLWSLNGMDLLAMLRQVAEQYRGVQLVVSGRYGRIEWNGWTVRFVCQADECQLDKGSYYRKIVMQCTHSNPTPDDIAALRDQFEMARPRQTGRQGKILRRHKSVRDFIFENMRLHVMTSKGWKPL